MSPLPHFLHQFFSFDNVYHPFHNLLRKKYLAYPVILPTFYARVSKTMRTNMMILKTDEKQKLLETLRRREHYCRQGLLRSDRTADGKLAIYTYTDKFVSDARLLSNPPDHSEISIR